MYQEQPDNNGNKIFVYMILAMTVVIFLVVGLMFLDNYEKQSSVAGYQLARERALEQRGISTEVQSSDPDIHKPTSDELDIWTLPATGRSTATQNDKSEESTKDSSLLETQASEEIPPEIEEKLQENKSMDGLDGVSFQKDGNFIKEYRNGKVVSRQGVLLSWEQGNINMKRLKNAGCEFVMLQVGKRGYCSGNIVMDESFQKNLEDALACGLKVGLVFTTNAISKDELLEEVDTLVTSVRGYSIEYPVVLSFDEISDDVSRTDGLSVENRTDLAIYFAKEMSALNYKPCIRASKAFLEERLNLSELEQCDIWMIQNADSPETDYRLTFWQYQEGLISGVTNKTDYLMQLDYN